MVLPPLSLAVASASSQEMPIFCCKSPSPHMFWPSPFTMSLWVPSRTYLVILLSFSLKALLIHFHFLDMI